MSLLCLVLITLPVSIQVTVAPDQPLSYVYIDDPLIIEFLSEVEMDINAQMLIQASHETGSTAIDLGRIHLHEDSGYWYAVHDAPHDRGFYTATITMESATETSTVQVSFCRIDRPASLQHIPVYAYCGDTEEKCAFPAIHSIGIDTFRCDMDNEQFLELAQKVSLYESNLIVAMTLEHARQFSEEEIERIQSQCENIFRLDLSLTSTETSNQNITDILRRIGCPAGISIVEPSVDAFEQQLLANPSLSAKHATLMTFVWPDPSEILAIKDIAARQGQEGWQVHVLCPAWQPRDSAQTIQFIHKFLQYRAANASFIGINANVLADSTGVQEMMAYMNGLALCFHNNTYVGALPTEGTAQALLFRKGASWFAALWSEETEGKTVSIPVDGAVSLKLRDARGNELPVPEITNGALTLSTTPAPIYLTGNGGIILGRAALQEIVKEAENITRSEAMTTQLPATIPELINAIIADPQGAGSRLRFLDLLRILPRLEEDWHTHKLPCEVAVPAIRSIAKLARTLCLVEEDRGERFLEPLTDTIDRAAELQSLYLTGSAGSAQARKRGDWILGEVRRLIDEAETLNQAGRKIEATAVAALAEWRAHCLLYAAKAEPVRESVQEIQPLILPEPVEETINAPAIEEDNEATQDAGEGEQNIEPSQEETSEETTTEDEENQNKPEKASEIIHKVKSGDNPYTIAKKYGVSLDDLLKWNNLKKKSILHIGQELVVKVAE